MIFFEKLGDGFANTKVAVSQPAAAVPEIASGTAGFPFRTADKAGAPDPIFGKLTVNSAPGADPATGIVILSIMAAFQAGTGHQRPLRTHRIHYRRAAIPVAA